MYEVKCRHFSGYKPCVHQPAEVCGSSCSKKDIRQISILFIHLGAIGAVVRSTSLLGLIKKKYPSSLITWVTDSPSDQLLRNHPQVDRVLTTSGSDLLCLSALEFDVGFVVDKSLKASGVLKHTKVDMLFGFVADEKTGAIHPVNGSAQELWEIGLNNQKKFFENKKTEQHLMAEALELGPWNKQEYFLPLSNEEKKLSADRKLKWQKKWYQPVIGFNTGCSSQIPYKKWTVEFHRKVILKLNQEGFSNLVLLGGPEDQERNQQISRDLPVEQSPTNLGLRDGLASVDACDMVISGDSLGMHLAIARKKYVLAWFGPTCAHEIELYGRGEALISPVKCGPCWKRNCQNELMCYDQISIDAVLMAVQKGFNNWKSLTPFSLTKQPFLETPY
jgi:heptosyltransferase II